MDNKDLEARLIDFSVRLIKLIQALPKTPIGMHLADQLGRSGTSPALHYGEAQAAESRNDFIHKMKVCLKELRETRINLLIIQKAVLIKSSSRIDPLIIESDELISIFIISINTANKNKIKSNK